MHKQLNYEFLGLWQSLMQNQTQISNMIKFVQKHLFTSPSS